MTQPTPKPKHSRKPTNNRHRPSNDSLASPRATDKPASIPDALADFDRLPDSAHVRMPIVAPLFGISVVTAWRWARSGRLPAPKKLGPNTTAWNVGDLRRAMAAVQEA